MFVINGSYDTSSEFTTYYVKVLSNNTGKAPAKSPVTIYFAAPLGNSTANNWSSANLAIHIRAAKASSQHLFQVTGIFIQ